MKLANKPFDEITVGDSASIERICTVNDLVVFAHASGNLNPVHLPNHQVDGAPSSEIVAPSMWVGSLVSAVLGNVLPGRGTLYKSQALRFLDRAHVGDSLTVTVTVKEKGEDRCVTLDCTIDRQDGVRIAEGEAVVIAPAEKIDGEIEAPPELLVNRHSHFDRLMETARGAPPLVTLVVCPEDAHSLGGALMGRDHKLIEPIFVGDAVKIHDAAKAMGKSIEGIEIIDIPGHKPAAERAVAMIHEGRGRALMKGHLHTDILLGRVVKKETGLRTARRLSHVFVMDVPGLDHLLLVTDAAINILPDLETKVDIVQNAIDLARTLGIEQPKVGILSAVETVNPKIPSTLDAAVLSKMAERGQIKGGLVDGPLAMDNAVDLEAARTKGITSLVAGRADVLVAPNLEAGNMLAKELTYVAHAEGAGIVLGAAVPIMLTSRADHDMARLASCAVAQLYERNREDSGRDMLRGAR